MNQQTVDMLTDMKLSAMAAEFTAQLQEPSFRALSFEERFSMAVTAEWNRRQTNKVERSIKKAHFSAPSATMEGIEYYEDRRLDKSQMLRLSTCKYVDEGHHVILEGASGNGKTYIACALGNAACRRFKKVAYIRMPELLDEITIARSSGELKKLLAAYKKVDLLILDEWLLLKPTDSEQRDIFELLHRRRKKSSTIFCSQYEFEEWYDQLGGDASPLADAIIDRIAHDSYRINITSIDAEHDRSMREVYGLDKALRE